MNSDKIIRIALINKYPAIDIDSLMEVINQTPNATVATETILGVYEAPEIPLTSKVYSSEGLGCFKSFEKYTEKVTYEYDTTTTKTLYFETQESADACLEYDEKVGRDRYSNGTWQIKKEFKVPIIQTTTASLETWLKNSK